jgi:hypothetical protein
VELVFGFALLVLAGAIVVLFAMFGELAARVDEPGGPSRWSGTRPLEEARIGHEPADWPVELRSVAAADQSLLLVLSTACGSCQEVATQLGAIPDKSAVGSLSFLLSTSSATTGQEFVEHHGLTWMPHYVDVGGAWVRNEFGVQMSPVGLVLSHGRLEAAHVFGDVAAMTAAAAQTFMQHRHEEVAS